MADKQDRTPGSVPGAWYVDSSCIGCGLCASTVPGVFSMEGDLAIVHRQPGSTEIADCEDALNSCPAGSIGKDG